MPDREPAPGSPARREVVVVSCVTFETAKVVEPILFYGADRAHLINFVKDEGDPSLQVYGDFCREVIRQLTASGMDEGGIEVHRHPVYDFQSMMRALHLILRREEGRELLVNVSAGTAEYTAAATIASMMVPGVKPFTVSTRRYLIPPERLREIYYDGERPVGMSLEVRDPVLLETYPIEEPPEALVRGLRIYRQIQLSRKRPTHNRVIRELQAAGLWDYVHKPRGPGEGKETQAVLMHYRRRFLDEWVGRGWMVKGEDGNALTDAGLRMIETFHTD